MDYCDECQEHTNDHYEIANNIFCFSCINKYQLVKCPGLNCNNVISLNEYGYGDVENNTCTMCRTIVCNSCIVKTKNLTICSDCFDK